MSIPSGQTRYSPSSPPTVDYNNQQLRDVLKWIDEEHLAMATAISGLEYQYPPMSAPPERFRVGVVAYADGVGWNPGAGEGLYVYKSTGWTLIA